MDRLIQRERERERERERANIATNQPIYSLHAPLTRNHIKQQPNQARKQQKVQQQEKFTKASINCNE